MEIKNNENISNKNFLKNGEKKIIEEIKIIVIIYS
jgi:hypothetical protein